MCGLVGNSYGAPVDDELAARFSSPTRVYNAEARRRFGYLPKG